MMISTKGRYALRVMLDLALHRGEGHIPMKEVARRQGISLKYIERIMPAFSKKGLVDGIHGKGGGYCLNREPNMYTVGEILRLTEGELAPVACLKDGALPCERREECRTLSMWTRFYEMTNSYFDSITLADLLEEKSDLGDTDQFQFTK